MTDFFQNIGGTLVANKFANTEPRPVSTSLAVAKRVEASEGPERDGYKPLMRNRTGHKMSSPTGSTASDTFSGTTFDPRLDEVRLTGQLKRVRDFLSDGEWRTLEQIATGADVPLSTVSSRIRDLRKPQFGMYTVESKRVSAGLWVYQIPIGFCAGVSFCYSSGLSGGST